MFKLLRTILLLFSCLIMISSEAQQLIFKNLNDLKLPAQECYNIMQDNKGYIWFSSEAGLCRYNGDEVKVYSANKGLGEKMCYGICEFPIGKLWFITSKNRILYYDEKNDSLIEAKFSPILSKFKNESDFNKQYYSIQVQNDSCLWICSQYSSLSVNIYTNKVSESTTNNSSFYFINNNTNLLLVKSRYSYYRRDNLIANRKENTYPISIISQNDTLHHTATWDKNYIPLWRCYTIKNNSGEYFIGWDNKLIKLKKDNSFEIYTTTNTILALHTSKNNDLWVGTLKGGLLCFKNSEFSNPILSLQGVSVSGVCEDHEQGIWCSSLEKGIYYCLNKHIIDYSLIEGLNKKPLLFKTINNSLYYASSDYSFLKVNNSIIKTIYMKFRNGFAPQDIILNNSNYIISSGSLIVRCDTNFNNKIILKEANGMISGGKNLVATGDDKIFSLGYCALQEISGALISTKKMLSSPNNVVLRTHNDLLIGCKDGLYRLNLSDYSIQKIKGLNGSVSGIIEGNNNEIWVATKDNGLYVLENETIRNISETLQLKDVLYYGLCKDKNNTIWVASNIGIIKISSRQEKMYIYDVFDGLPSNEIHNIATNNENVYYSTSYGLGSFGLNEDLNNKSVAPLSVTSIKVNGRKTNIDNIILKYNENSIEILCDIITFKSINTPILFYSLKSESMNEELYLKERHIKLDNLSPGNYTLTLCSINNDKVRGMERCIRFEIRHPYWQTYWFGILCILLFFGILYFIVKLSINRIKKREVERTRINNMIAESQLTALQAQMNPHFIFNAINSIQRYILEKSKHEAYDYLAKFSRLIRMVLHNSEEKILPLEKEIEAIVLYIELEQLRFKHSFDFTIIVNETIDTYKTQIPSMLIQPYIENAIWHGLMNLKKDQKGKLLLAMNIKKGLLYITIEDNGIGRAKASEYKKNEMHKPIAMKLTEQRLKMINQLQNYESAEVLVSDLYDEQGNVSGTKVEIILPLLNES